MYYLRQENFVLSITLVILKCFTYLNEAMFLHEIPSFKGAVIQNCGYSFISNVVAFLLGKLEMPGNYCAICGIKTMSMQASWLTIA